LHGITQTSPTIHTNPHLDVALTCYSFLESDTEDATTIDSDFDEFAEFAEYPCIKKIENNK
jgi:hypothetical protein